jgi:hypothetical protein
MAESEAAGTRIPLPPVGNLEGILELRARIATAVIQSCVPAEAAAVLPSAASAIVAAFLAAGHRSVAGEMGIRSDGGLQILLEGGGGTPGHPVVDPPRVTLPPLLPGGVTIRDLEGGARWSIAAAGSPDRASDGGLAALYEAESALLHLASGNGSPAEKVSVSHLLEELGAAFQGRARRGGVVLEVQLPPDDLHVRGERDRLFSLLSEMLGNAFRFSREGDGVTVTAGEENGDVRISVADTGPGMSPEVLEGLFTWDWTPGGPPPPGGGGPGFALARRGAEAMGGRFLAESREGEGTRVHLVLPLN